MYLDDEAEQTRLNLLHHMKVWESSTDYTQELFDNLKKADLTVSSWIDQGNISPECKARLLQTLKYVEYHCFDIEYWGYQEHP